MPNTDIRRASLIAKLRHRLAALFAIALITGCATRAPETPVSDTTPAPRPDYTPATLADLLVAEVAAQRNVLGVTMGYYGTQALENRDPKVAEQAARLAAFLNDPAHAIELAEVWLEGEPNSSEAREILAISEVRLGNAAAAADHIDVLLSRHPDEALLRLVGLARGLDSNGNATLLAALGSLTDRHPRQAPLWYAKALHLQQQEAYEEALTSCEKAIKLNRKHEDALLLKGRLLYQLDRKNDTWRHLSRLLKRYPDAKRVRVLYIRLLLEDGQHEQASLQLAELAARHPEEQELRFSLAMFGMEQGARDEAAPIFRELLDEGFRPDDMHLYLARAAELDDDPHAAIDHYMRVGAGPNQTRARLQAARLLYLTRQDDTAAELMATLRDRHPDQIPALYVAESDMLSKRGDHLPAMVLLSDAMASFPNNTELLYARAMTAEKLNNLQQLEADLRRMLEIRPNDATALNALGYTLTDRTDRHQEAFGYISAALEQRPEDPAIIDSMGWVLYRLGRPDEALPYLQRAYEAYPDPEIASHLGEVLWVLGQKKEARRIWQDTLKAHPDNDIIRETVTRMTGQPDP